MFPHKVQMYEAKPHEKQWVADQLGHSMIINDDVYRKNINTISLTKTSVFLNASLSNKAHLYKGKSLTEMCDAEIDPLQFEENDEDEENEEVIEDVSDEEEEIAPEPK